MAASLGHVLAQMQRWAAPRLADLSDALLLERFVQRRDESAFAALLTRHGAMVLRSCRRVLGDAHESEDAFQATFLILANKAHTLRQPGALPGFLHRVAHRVALKARRKAGVHAGPAPLPDELPDPRSDPLARLTARELLTVLDEEVARLSMPQRSAVILCCLEGHTQEEAARQLGWTAGSLRGHLERGRRRLQERLRGRGIALPAALAILAVSRGEAASPLLLRSAITTALSGGIGSSAAALAHGILRTMLLSKLAGMAALVLTVALAVSTTAALVYRGAGPEAPEDNKPAAPAASKGADAGKPNARTDVLGDPLPAGAIARLGTVRFRHAKRISHMAFTPDGKRLVSRGDDGVYVWDTATGKELRHFAADAERVGFSIDTDVSADGKRVAVAGYGPDGVIQFWDVDSGKKTGSLGTKLRPIIRFSPDGKLLAASSAPTDVELWDVAGQKKLRSWKASPSQVSLLRFSADSRRLLTASVVTNEIRLWDTATGRLIHEFSPPGKLNPGGYHAILPMALSPDGNLLAIRGWGDRIETAPGKVEWKTDIKLRDSATGKTVRRLTCPTSANAVGGIPDFRALTFTADGKRLITGGPDRFVRIWDVQTGKELRRFALDSGPATRLALSRDGNKLAAVVNEDGNTIRVLDLASGETATAGDGHFGPIVQAALSPDGRTAVTSGPDGRRNGTFGPLNYVYVWDAATGRIRHRLDGRGTPFLWMQRSEDGRTLFSCCSDKMLRVWDVASAQERRRIKVPSEPRNYVAPDRVALTPDGKTLAVMDEGQMIHVLDAANGVERQQFRWPNEILGMKLTPDGRLLTMWSYDCKIRIYDVKFVRKLPDGNPLEASTGSSARIWDLRGGRPLHEYALPQAGNRGYDAAVSPDGRLLAAMGVWSPLPPEQPMLLFMDLTNGQIIRRINVPLHTGMLAFSPDGRALAWSSATGRAIHLLEVASGRERRRLLGHRGPITALAFSADGRRLLSGCADSTALVWDLTADSASHPAAAAEVERLWNDLAGADAARAYRMIHRLAVSPSYAIPFMRKQLRPAAAVDEKRLARRIADLDSDDFATREKAGNDLAKFGEQAVPAYRRALESKPSLEARRRLEDLLEKARLAWWDVSGERLRALRAIEVLELAGTRQARELLATLAAGTEGARLTHEAQLARERLARRSGN